MDIEIRNLSKDLQNDYLFLFDNMIHKDNPDWSKCYCNHYHFLGDVESCTIESSREMIINRIKENELRGYLVFDKDNPIGWCNANNRSNFQRLLRDFDLIDNLEDKVFSIVCFLIHPDYRRQGIAQMILEKIINEHSYKDYDYIEAYPQKGESNNSNFNGPLELFLRYDFKIHKKQDTHYVVRKK